MEVVMITPLRATVIGLTLLALAGIPGLGTDTAAAQPAPTTVRMATTTSTANTGLLDYLLPEFEKDTGIHVEFVATGTGQALTHGQNGDVDIVLVHAPAAEEKFVADGFGVARVPVFWNDFVLAGPRNDPAGIKSAADGADALRRVSEHQSPFISRGDDSGTHKKEKELWKKAGVTPAGAWYIEAGQGMGACLTMASEKLAYVLTDRGTFLSMAGKLDLGIDFEGGPDLLNPYALIEVSPAKYPDANHKGAQRLIEWMTSPRARELVVAFKPTGQQLFYLFEDQTPGVDQGAAGEAPAPPPSGAQHGAAGQAPKSEGP
jgi:tungstate transport system substrate-binding protein